MTRSTTITARIEPKLKKAAEALLQSLGISHSDLVNMTYRQLVMHRGLPFEAKVPNATTRKAIRDGMAGKGLRRYTSVDELRREFK